MTFLSNLISALFHPAFMPSISLFIVIYCSKSIFFENLNPVIARAILLVSVIFTLVFPILTILLFRIFGFVKSVKLESKEERRLPLLLSIGYFFMAYHFLFTKLPIIPSVFWNLPFAGALLLLITYLINLKYQISIHMLSSGAMLATLCVFHIQFGMDLRFWIAIGVLVCGLVASARLWLNAHSTVQIYSGFFVGFFVQFYATQLLV